MLDLPPARAMGNLQHHSSSRQKKLAAELRSASETGQFQLCSRLCKKRDFDINLADGDGLTALHFASFCGRQTASRFLKDTMGIAHEEENILGKTRKQSELIVQLLIKHGADVNAKETHMGFTCLHLASCYGNSTLLQCMLQHGASVDETDKFGKTALHWASQGGHLQVCELLLAHCTEKQVNALDVHKRTALHWAAAYGNTAVCKFLLEHGARVDVYDVKHYTPVHIALHFQQREAVKVLRVYELWENLLVLRSCAEVPRLGSKCAMLPRELTWLVARMLTI